MSEQERQQAFAAAIQRAEHEFGYTLISTIQVDGLGVVASLSASPIKPGPVSLLPVEGWQEQVVDTSTVSPA